MLNRNWVFILLFSDIILPLLISITIIITIIIIVININNNIIIDLTHSKSLLENTVEIEPQPVGLDFKNLS